MNKNLLLVGAGPMAIEYAKVLNNMNVPFEVVGRGKDSAVKFEEAIGTKVTTGGIEEYLSKNKMPSFSHAIITVNERELGTATKLLMKNNIKNILVEKPGGLDPKDISSVYTSAKEFNTNLYVGYNRRFYASVNKARQIIKEDGGVTSFNFEFTEWSHVIKDLVKAQGVKEMWYLHNSTHIVDLAFYLGGRPKQISCYNAGGLAWHPSASVFVGAGVSENGALFSYQANWEAPGRWGVEVLTKKHRLILRPLEKLQIQNIGSVAVEPVEINDEIDKNFKPGLFVQTENFLNANSKELCTISEQVDNLKVYQQIGNI